MIKAPTSKVSAGKIEAEIRTSSHRPCRCKRTGASRIWPSRSQTIPKKLEYACRSMLAQLLLNMTFSQGELKLSQFLGPSGLPPPSPTLNTKPRGKVTCARALVKW
ncbi:hypothetical protein N8I77_008003 [Diaporthe amygdali]|uniref:Uncharacterized protein n=1 Tax=Phomopsis amygdali TaxID=1214568 RepID=A0AAD9W2J5_PHOAM|nr:hypothetical protein N8I77_008003 [Diaporthe amygdali]